MTKAGSFERAMNRILCAASCLLFMFALWLQLAEFFVSEKTAVRGHMNLVSWVGGKPERVCLIDEYPSLVTRDAVQVPVHHQAAIVLMRAFSPSGDFVEPVSEWEPEESDVIALAQTLYGECRGCSFIQQCAVCWCIFNRIDSPEFPNSLIGVVSAPSQLQGYSSSNPVWDSLYEVAYNCLVDWHNGENRVLDEDMCFFSGWGGINHFRNAWLTEDATKFWEES